MNGTYFSVRGQGQEFLTSSNASPVPGCFKQWPKQPRESGRSLDEEDFPRNMPVHRLKAALQKTLAEAPCASMSALVGKGPLDILEITRLDLQWHLCAAWCQGSQKQNFKRKHKKYQK